MTTDMDNNHHERIAAADRSYTRRTVLAATALVALAGCMGDDEEAVEIPDPVSLNERQVCDSCGMVIADHPGPDGEIYYREGRPEDRDGPAWFCSIDCMNSYNSEKVRLGWEPIVSYTTDYSAVDYEIVKQGGDTYISSHPEQEAFADVEDLAYVVDTAIEGAMGATPVPFSTRDEAEAFADEHDGSVVEWDAVEGG